MAVILPLQKRVVVVEDAVIGAQVKMALLADLILSNRQPTYRGANDVSLTGGTDMYAVIPHGYSLGEMLIMGIVIVAAFIIAWIAFRAMGWEPPGWAVQILWIIVIAVVAILAIRFVLSL